MIHVRIADNNAKLDIELVNEGYQFNILDFNRSIFVIINNEIILNNYEYYKHLFVFIEVRLLTQGQFPFGNQGPSAYYCPGSVLETAFRNFSTG
jgi:hypothetical protein